jgi:hypothetical protein
MTIAERSPFYEFRIRGLLLWHLLIVPPLVFPLGWIRGWIGLNPSDPIGIWVAMIWIYALILAVTLWRLHQTHISVRRLFGRVPCNLRWLQSVYVVVPLDLFALGAIFLVYVPLSFVSPRFVENVIGGDGPPFLCYSSSKTTSVLLCNGLCIALLVILIPIVEELLFRGVLLHRWAVKWGKTRAILLSSFVFAAFHMDVIGGFVFGYVMAVLYWRNRTLFVPIVCHLANNALVLCGTYLTFHWQPPSHTNVLQDFRSHWWIGAICLTFSVPWVIYFLWRYRPQQLGRLPYVDNMATRDI